MQGREQGAGTDHEDTVRHLLDPVRDADTVHSAQFQRAENQEVQRSLQQIAQVTVTLDAGNYHVDASYSGDAAFTSSSDSLMQKVN
jgi:hypothetical protein